MRLFALLLSMLFLSTAASTQDWFNLDEASGWKSCGTPRCSGGLHTANYLGPLLVGRPSLDGTSARFMFVKPNPSYSNALYWYNTICCSPGVSAPYTQFRYDLYFFVKTPNVIQALEFDVNQTISDQTNGTSVRYVYGHECNLVETGTWRIWDEAYGWVDTGIGCKVRANSWHHLTFELQRASTGQVYYSTITMNGVTNSINYRATPRQLNVLADDLNVAFQMDSNSDGDTYSAWLDKITLTAR